MQQGTSRYGCELDAAIRAARAGGAVVKEFYDRATAATYEKGDGSPVTDADLAADRVIRGILRQAFPNDAILTEEGQDDLTRLTLSRCWIVDPVDGTEQFIARTGEFDVLVALVEDGRPVAVAGFQPTTCTLVTATLGGGAWLQNGGDAPTPIALAPPENGVRLATSKWFGAPDNQEIMFALAMRIGSDPGQALVTGFTPRMFLSPRTFDVMVGVRAGKEQRMASEWDFAVNDLVISEAGGVVTDLSGAAFRYNKERPSNDGGLVAAVDPRTHAIVLEALQAVRGA